LAYIFAVLQLEAVPLLISLQLQASLQLWKSSCCCTDIAVGGIGAAVVPCCD
jgi:hypothetical protein